MRNSRHGIYTAWTLVARGTTTRKQKNALQRDAEKLAIAHNTFNPSTERRWWFRTSCGTKTRNQIPVDTITAMFPRLHSIAGSDLLQFWSSVVMISFCLLLLVVEYTKTRSAMTAPRDAMRNFASRDNCYVATTRKHKGTFIVDQFNCPASS